MNNIKDDLDINGDGIVTEKEIEIYEQRAKNRRRMAWVSLVAMVVTAFALMFFVDEKRLGTLSGLLELYWLGLGGVVATYVGVSAWSKKG
jgi:uncharacterized membrane protein